MAVKQPTDDQCRWLHQMYPPPDCCLCNCRARIAELEAEAAKLRAEVEAWRAADDAENAADAASFAGDPRLRDALLDAENARMFALRLRAENER